MKGRLLQVYGRSKRANIERKVGEKNRKKK